MAPGVPVSAMASTMPGKPAPEPTSIQIRARGASSMSCSESAICRVHRRDTVDGAMRLLVRCQRSRRSTKRSRRSEVSRETGVSAKARERSAARSGAAAPEPIIEAVTAGNTEELRPGPSARTGHTGTSGPALEMRHEQRQRRRGDAVHARGLADSGRARGRKLLADLVGQPRELRIVEALGQLQAFVAAIRGDIRGLAGQVDLVFGIDLELRGNLCRQIGKLRPDPPKLSDPDIRVREQLESAAPAPVAIESEALAVRRVRGERDGACKVARR